MTLSIALRASLLLATALAARAFTTRPSTRRDLLTLGAVGACAMPLFALAPALPSPSITAPGALAASSVAVSGALTLQEPASTAATTLAWEPILLAVWAIGAGLLGLRIGIGALGALQLRRGTEPVDAAWAAAADEVDPGLEVRAHADLAAPVLLGWLRPVIAVPSGVCWSHTRRVRALRHELAHARSHDNIRLLVGQLVAAVHWFDPAAWVLVRSLRLEIERAADEAVVATGEDPTVYAADLVDLARSFGNPRTHAQASLGGSPLEQRVRALLDRRGLPGSQRVPRWLLGVGLAASAVVIGTIGAPAAARSGADVQHLVDAELNRLVAEWAPEAVAIAVVDAQSGEVVAVAGEVDRRWASGSVIKPFVSVAAIEAGLEGDRTELAHLLEVSSNDGFVALSEAIGPERLSRSLHRQGLSDAAPLAPADLALGQFPTTARELATAFARLDDTAEGREVLDLLTAVVHGDQGTGRAAAVPGVRVAGKTGTTQLGPDSDAMLASFVGAFPADDPQWVIAIQVAAPQPRGWGGLVAAPAFANLAAALR